MLYCVVLSYLVVCYVSVCYSADGTCVLAGGESKWVCIYQVSRSPFTSLLVSSGFLSNTTPSNLSLPTSSSAPAAASPTSLSSLSSLSLPLSSLPPSGSDEHSMLLLKKFQVSKNRALDGVLEKLNSGRMTEGFVSPFYSMSLACIAPIWVNERRQWKNFKLVRIELLMAS